MPSSPILQACRNTLSPSWARCSFRRSPEGSYATGSRASPCASPAQVLAIQLKEVEDVEEDMLARRLEPQPFEHRESVLIAGDRFAIDQAGAHLEPVNGLNDERITRRPIVPVPG